MARVLVIGGTGVASAHCTTALIEDGHIVGTFRRGTARPTPIAPGSLTILGDRNDSAALGKAMTDFAPGIVIDFMCFTPAQADALLEVLAPSCRHLVFVSTVDVYGMPLPRLPMTETVPWSAPGSDYAAAKRRVEELLVAGLKDRRRALTIVRPTYSLGDSFLISLFDRSGAELIARLRLGAPVLLPDGGTRLIHPSDARDTGRMIALAAASDAAVAQHFTVGTPGATMTQRQYVERVAEALGVQPRFEEVDAGQLDQPGVLAPDSLWHELTCHDLSYDLGRFTRHYKGFSPLGQIEEQIRAYAARLDPASDEARALGPEARALRALTAAR